MKKILLKATAIVLIIVLSASPIAEAQTRGRGGSQPTRPATSASEHRPSQRPSQNANRPGNSNNHQRPDKPQHQRPMRPGTQSHNKPPQQSHGRPHYHNQQPPRPHNRPRPKPQRHPHGYRHPVPVFHAWHRPVPPPRWHYRGGGPSFGTILGVALGTAIGVSISALANNGYNVASYGDNVVYLNDVPQMNYVWPDAALYYNNGVLTGSQFTYSTPYYNLNRYNALYHTFTAQYGIPVQTTNSAGVISATWYGAGNRYVSLTFNSNYSGNYYTTLSFGN